MKRILAICFLVGLTGLWANVANSKTTELWNGDGKGKITDKEEIAQRACMFKVEKLRGLKFKKMVKSKALPLIAFSQAFGQKVNGRLPLGFYRYSDETLYINADADAKRLESIRVHETVHALQHQLWGVRNAKTTEEDHIQRVIREGEATSVAWTLNPAMKAMMGSFVTKWRDNRGDLAQFTEKTVKENASLQERTAFDYTIAAKFIDKLVEKHGWEAVNKLYKEKPVLSTEQVLHPEKYMDKGQWDAPTKFDFPNLPKAMGDSWKIHSPVGKDMHYNTMGEFEMMLRYLISPKTGPVADKIAAGWDGDWHVVVTNGMEGCEVWMTAWDSPNDAKEWADAQIKYFNSVFIPRYAADMEDLEKAELPKELVPAFRKVSNGKSTAQLYTYDGGYVMMEVFGNYALFVETSKTESMASILKAIADKTASMAVAEKPVEAKKGPAGGEGMFEKAMKVKVTTPKSWIDAWRLMNRGQFKAAEDFVTKDKDPMSAKLLERLNQAKEAKRLCKEGKFAEARKIQQIIHNKGRYTGMAKVLKEKIDTCEKTGEWPEEK